MEGTSDAPPIASRGLSAAEAAGRLVRYGPNRLPEARQPGVVRLFVRQFLNPFIYILLFAAAVSLLLREVSSAVFIAIVLLINAAIGTFQEFLAQRSAAALRSMTRGRATVIRDGRPQEIDADDIVPGDLLSLASGDKVAADGALRASESLGIDESMLTGESLAVQKDAVRAAAADATLGDRTDRVFAGTIVTHGRGVAEVTETGFATELGKIADTLVEREAAAPPLMIRIRRFTVRVSAAILGATAILAAAMWFQAYGWTDMLMMSIGLVVAAVPEGLPAALTVTLALGMNRMARRGVIIRNLLAVEALGSCTFICTDKTGTLTVNELTVRRVVLPDGAVYRVAGEGLEPGGEIAGGPLSALEPLIRCAVSANEGTFVQEAGHWRHHGDMVDVALLVLAEKAGLDTQALRRRHAALARLAYEPERAWAASVNLVAGGRRLFVKGSAEKLVAMCSRMRTVTGDAPIATASILQEAHALARQGYRVLAFAEAEIGGAEIPETPGGLTFLGLVGMIDPLRPEAPAAIVKCRSAAIEVAMITGDHPETARHIALELGLIEADDEIVNGAALRRVSGAAFDRMVAGARVFARIEPDQKRQIVEALSRAGHFVAVTGDGVNDAPALRAANAGIAMGRRGSDVARETANLILTDDNFASIVAGIEQGRVVYANIRKIIEFLIATAVSAVLLFFLSVAGGQPMPLTAVQLLWFNLVANGVQDVSLGFEPGEGGELDAPPRRPSEPIFERRMVEQLIVNGGVIGLLSYAAFSYSLWSGETVEASRNVTLMLMILFGNLHALTIRSERRSVFAMPLWRNPVLVSAVIFAQSVHIMAMYVTPIGDVLEVRPIGFDVWLQLLAVASTLIVASELLKRHQARRSTVSAG